MRRPGGGARDSGGFEVVPQQPPLRGKKRPMLSAEELALGEKMVYSKKSKRDMMDAGWNRWAATLKLLGKRCKKSLKNVNIFWLKNIPIYTFLSVELAQYCITFHALWSRRADSFFVAAPGLTISEALVPVLARTLSLQSGNTKPLNYFMGSSFFINSLKLKTNRG